MTARTTFFLLTLLAVVFQSCYEASPVTQSLELPEKSDFNEDWSFTIDGIESAKIDIPHTPRIEPLIVNDQWQGSAKYTKNIIVDNPSQANTWLHFEGVMHE
ncbi:MAG: hypothetical protein HRT61_20510, partial [Ekhidna sp.]|nr:hypothetical protein [Ekhidna sp.]